MKQIFWSSKYLLPILYLGQEELGHFTSIIIVYLSLDTFLSSISLKSNKTIGCFMNHIFQSINANNYSIEISDRG